MFELLLQDFIALIPDSFRDGKKASGNIHKIIKVFNEELNKDMDILEDVSKIIDLNTQTGVTLDLTGAGFGLTRLGDDDDTFRIRIQAFKSGSVIGNDINSILSLFRLLTGASGLDVRIKEKFDDDLVNPRPRAFDIILDTLDTPEALALLPVALAIKAGGVDVTIDELSIDSFLTQGSGDLILQENGGKLILESGNLP